MSGTTSEFMNPGNHEIVRAGAGAGKTYALTHKVIDLAREHQETRGRFPRLIVTTFTRKATQELRERLMLLALEENPEFISFVNSRAYLHVGTIHGVMDMYLKRYGANINVDPSYRVIGAPEAAKLARQVMRGILLDGSQPTDLLEVFNFNTLVSLARKITATLSENPDAKPFTVADFAEIFEEKKARALGIFREVAARLLEETDVETWIQIAKCCQHLAKQLATDEWNVRSRELFLMTAESMPVVRRNAKGAKSLSESTIDLAKKARELANEFGDPLFDPEAWRLFTSQYQIIDEIARRFAKEFRAVKLEQGALEIGDLEHFAISCLREYPATAEAFSQEWDHWLVDEFQDTSPFQVELIRLLSGGRPTFIVGDPQQSIYLFRGARADVFAQREREILGAGGQQRLLSQNRRSQPELLLFFNDFFSRLSQPFSRMEPFLREEQSIDASKVVAKVFVGADVGTDDGEMRAIVEHVRNLMREGVPAEEICVLARTNRVLVETAIWLDRARLPTQIHAASGFFDRREIRDALAYLKFLVNPHDGANLIELLRSPWFRVPDGVLVEFTRVKSQTSSVWERLIDAKSMAEELQAVSRLQEFLKLADTDGLSEAFLRGLIDAGFVDLAHTHDVSGRREANIWKLLAKLQAEESRPGFSALEFISQTRSGLNLDDANSEGDAVAAVEPNRINLMTVHASKGLEFRHVILPRMDERPRLRNSEEFTYDERVGHWALRMPYGDDRRLVATLPEMKWLETFRASELEEHARVLYVALTRASESVFLSWTDPVKTNSWAEMARLDLRPGVHREDSYSYEVINALAEPEIAESSASATTSDFVRKPWRSQAIGNVEKKATSVSDYLDQKPGPKRAPQAGEFARVLRLASQGTQVHRLMEVMKYRSRDLLTQLITKWFPGSEERVVAAIEFVRDLTQPPLLEIIANGEVERGFSMTEGSLLIEGQIDLWGRTNDGVAWIVDYKTGNPELRDKAFEQMELYALALRKSGWLRSEEPLFLAAVYPFAKEIFTLEAPTVEQLRSQLFARSSSGQN